MHQFSRSVAILSKSLTTCCRDARWSYKSRCHGTQSPAECASVCEIAYGPFEAPLSLLRHFGSDALPAEQVFVCQNWQYHPGHVVIWSEVSDYKRSRCVNPAHEFHLIRPLLYCHWRDHETAMYCGLPSKSRCANVYVRAPSWS